MLTAHDVRALKHADSLCFDRLADGTGRIRAIRRADASTSGYEETHTIDCGTSGVVNYDTEGGNMGGNFTAFAMIMSAQYNDVGRTLIKHMRAGCEVRLSWTADNSSPITKEAGLVRDELRVKIQPKGAKVADTFLVQVSVGYDNSARMVRRA